MKKFEYKQITCNGDFHLVDLCLNNEGKEGWELVSLLHLGAKEYTFFFKRELVDAANKPLQPLKKSESVEVTDRPLVAEMSMSSISNVPSMNGAKMMKIGVHCPDIDFKAEYDYAFVPSMDALTANRGGMPNQSAVAANIESKLRADLTKAGYNPNSIKWV